MTAEQIKANLGHKIPPNFKWLAVNRAGAAWCFTEKPEYRESSDCWVVSNNYPELFLGTGHEPTSEPVHIQPVEDLHIVIRDLRCILDSFLSDWHYIAIDADGVYNAFQDIPTYCDGCWESAKDVLYIGRMYDQEGVELWKNNIIDKDLGLINVGDASDLGLLFDEIKEHLDVAKQKHPEYPNNKGYGLAAVTEEYLELTRAINDNESPDRIIEEAKDSIVTLIRLIGKVRQEQNQ